MALRIDSSNLGFPLGGKHKTPTNKPRIHLIVLKFSILPILYIYIVEVLNHIKILSYTIETYLNYCGKAHFAAIPMLVFNILPSGKLIYQQL